MWGVVFRCLRGFVLLLLFGQTCLTAQPAQSNTLMHFARLSFGVAHNRCECKTPVLHFLTCVRCLDVCV